MVRTNVDLYEGIEHYWDHDCHCGDIDCKGCEVPRRKLNMPLGNDVLDYYFPPSKRIQIRYGPSDGTGVLNTVELACSCVRCGALVLSGEWSNHINFHTNAVR